MESNGIHMNEVSIDVKFGIYLTVIDRGHMASETLLIIHPGGFLLPLRSQDIIWTNADLLPVKPLGTIPIEFVIEIFSECFQPLCKMLSGNLTLCEFFVSVNIGPYMN